MKYTVFALPGLVVLYGAFLYLKNDGWSDLAGMAVLLFGAIALVFCMLFLLLKKYFGWKTAWWLDVLVSLLSLVLSIGLLRFL